MINKQLYIEHIYVVHTQVSLEAYQACRTNSPNQSHSMCSSEKLDENIYILNFNIGRIGLLILVILCM